jgi:hypothetical protein
MVNVLRGWRAGSPNTNPVENLWTIPKRGVKELGSEIEEELIDMIIAAWEGIKISLANRLVDSIPERLKIRLP